MLRGGVGIKMEIPTQCDRKDNAMRHSNLWVPLYIALSLLFIPTLVQAQIPTWEQGGGSIPHPELPNSDLRGVEKGTWHIFGKITNFKGDPVRDAAVRVDIGLGLRYVKELTTDFQGSFRTEYTLDAVSVDSLTVSLSAEREGLRTAHEFVNFGKGGKTWEIDVTMMPDVEGENQISVESLVKALAPGYRASLAQDASLAAEKRDLQRGANEFLDRDNAARALPNLQMLVKRFPVCGDCRSLLGLAMLEAGAWDNSTRELAEAERLAVSNGTKAKQAKALLILAEMEDWRGEYNKAAGFLMQAKDLDPKNGLILQELGRTLIFQKNWEAADQYLGEARRAGAPKEAVLLRIRALLEEGDPEAASEAMKSYLAGADLKTFPLRVRSLDAQVQARMSMRDYGKVESVVTEPLGSLAAAIPELKGLEPASSQADLPAILKKTGEGVRSFFGAFPNTASLEEIREERLAKDGKTKDLLNERFQYLLLARPEKWGLGLEEFRTNSHGDRTAPVGLGSGLMVTSGFASASLVFHPAYQSGAAFRYLGRQTASGHECHVIAFAQDPKRAQMVERFNTSDTSVLVLFQGLAWIDAGTYEIVRLRTDLLTPQTKIRLQRQTTEITYDPVQFKQIASALWLPSEVAVTLQWAGKTYRNTHRYSAFRLFNTDTQERVGQPNLPAEPEDEQQPQQP